MAQRENLSLDEQLRLSQVVTQNLSQVLAYKHSSATMSYNSFRGEVHTKGINQQLLRKNNQLFLPVIPEGSDEITVSLFLPSDKLTRGKFNVPEPKIVRIAPPEQIDLVLVPGVVFDEEGYRIGFGKGYYDRFLPKLSCPRIGLCYEFQVIEEVPHAPHDQRLDILVTEKRIMYVNDSLRGFQS